MRVTIITRAVPKKGGRVRVDGLVYIVTQADEPTELDETTLVTDVELQPAGPVPGIPTIPARVAPCSRS